MTSPPKLRLIDHWKVAWRLWSIRFNALGLAFLSFDFVGAMHVWNMLPPDLRAVVPQRFLSVIGAVLFVLSMISRIIKQPNVEKRIRELLDPPA